MRKRPGVFATCEAQDDGAFLESLPCVTGTSPGNRSQELSDLRENPRHPSLRFKKVGKLWSARVGRDHRALAMEDEGDYVVWVWIDTHEEYNRLLHGQ